MQILQVKIRGTNKIQDSSWVTLSQRLTVIQGNDKQQRKEFLEGLETINPLFDLHSTAPFHDAPAFSLVNGHKKKIQPHKKTIAYAIYATTPNLTRELSEIDPIFYETDRIEVGRRLNDSCWVNFVEMSASTRWKEFEKLAQPFLGTLPSSSIDTLLHIVNTYKTNDRIIDTFSDKLTLWMIEIAQELLPEHIPLYEQCFSLIGRAERFNKARRYFENNLPPYILLDEAPPLETNYSLMKVNKKEPTNPLQILLFKCSNILKTANDVSIINDSMARIRQQLIEEIGFAVKTPKLFFTQSHLRISSSDSKTNTESNYLLSLILLSKLLYKSAPILLLHDIEQNIPNDMRITFFEQISHISKICQIILSTNTDMSQVEPSSQVFQFDQNSNSGNIFNIPPK